MSHRFGLPRDVWTGDPEDPDTRSRLRVDNEKTEFFRGREFFAFVEFSVATAESLSFKLVSAVDFIIYDQELITTAGSMKMEFFSGGSEAAPFNNSVPVYGKNQMVQRETPYYSNQVTLNSGGTFTGGTKESITFAAVGAQGNQSQVSQSRDVHDARGFPAGTYHIKLSNFSGLTTGTGVYKLWWAERP